MKTLFKIKKSFFDVGQFKTVKKGNRGNVQMLKRYKKKKERKEKRIKKTFKHFHVLFTEMNSTIFLINWKSIPFPRNSDFIWVNFRSKNIVNMPLKEF